MKMSGSACERLIVATEVDESDVEANQIEVGVDSEIIVARAAWQATGRCGAVHDLIWGGDDVVGRGEREGTIPAVSVAPAIAVIDILPSSWRCRVFMEVFAGALGVLDVVIIGWESSC